MNSIIKLNSFTVKPNGNVDLFDDETGTPDFYTVEDILKKYLGENNIWVSWDYQELCFVISDSEERDEGCDNIYDYIQIIESIYEPFDFPPGIWEQHKNDHLVFEIIMINY